MVGLKKQLWIKYGIQVIRVSFEICSVHSLLFWCTPSLSDWSTCQLSEKAVCGNGIKTRMLDCVRSDGKSVNLKYCEEVRGGCVISLWVNSSRIVSIHAEPSDRCVMQLFASRCFLLNPLLKRDSSKHYWFLHIISCILFCWETKGMLISPFWKKCLGNNK